MINEQFRLQLLHTEGVFETREKAKAHIEQQFTAKALTAEPAVAFYKEGNGEKTNAIFVIGLGNGNEVFTIDSAEILNKIEGLNGDTQEQEERLSEATNFISDIIESCGLTETFDADGKKYVYEPDGDDKIIGKSESLAEAIATLSEYVQTAFDNTDLTVKDTDTVSLKYKDSKDGGKVLKANVKVSSNGTSNNKSFDDNIICVKEDGLYVAVDLEYDEATQKLTFTTSRGDKDDVVKKEIGLGIGQHIDVEAKNNNDSPIVVTVEGDKVKQVSADVKILGGENNITVKEGKLYVKPVAADDMKVSAIANNIVKLYADGLFANVDVTYAEATNTLTFTNGNETKELKLNSANIIKDVRYDSDKNKLILSFVLTDGTIDEVEVDMNGLVDSWDVENTNHTVTLTLDHHHPKNDKLSADVNISGNEHNILKVNTGALEVIGISQNIIHHGATTVYDKLNEIDGTNAEFAKDLAKEISDRAKAIDDVLNKLDQETTARVNDVKEINTKIENLKVEELTQTVKDFKELYNQFHTEWAADKALIEKAIADAEAVAGRVAQLEKDLADTNKNLGEEIVRVNGLTEKVTTLETKVDAHITNYDTLNKNVSDLTNEVGNVKTDLGNVKVTAETNASKIADIGNSLTIEVGRATAKEGELEVRISTLETNSTSNSADISDLNDKLREEVDRAKQAENDLKSDLTTESANARAAEKQLENDLSTEVTRAKNEESRIEDLVKGNAASIKDNATDIKNLKDEDTRLNTALTAEETRAKAAEKQIEDNLANEIKTARDAEKANADAINTEKSRAEGVETEIKTAIGNIRIEKVDNDDRKYQLVVNESNAGYINIPKDQFLNDVRYDASTQTLTFVWSIGSADGGKAETTIQVSDLVNTYLAGDGLTLADDGKTFKVVVSAGSENFLTVGANGIAVNGVQTAIDNAVKVETDRATQAEGELTNSFNTLNDTVNGHDTKLTNLEGRVSVNESNITELTKTVDTINGNEALDGSFRKAVADAVSSVNNNTETKVGEEKDRAEKAENDLNTAVSSLKNAVDTINGNEATTGSIAYAVKNEETRAKGEEDKLKQSIEAEVGNRESAVSSAINESKKYTDEKVDDITLTAGDGIQIVNKAITVEVDEESEEYLKVSRTGVKVVGVTNAIETAKTSANQYTDTQVGLVDNKVSTNKTAIDALDARVAANESAIATINGDGEGSIKNAVINAKNELTETINSKVEKLEEKDAALDKKDTELEEAINGKVGSVEVRKESDTEYSLYVDGVKSGATINVPKDNFLKNVNYDSGTNVITFTLVNGDTFDINIHDLVNIYTAGKGLVLTDNEFGVSISTDAETAKYLVLTDDANAKIKLNGIDKAISDAAEKVKGECTYTVGEGLVISDNKISGYVLENEKYLNVGLNGFYTAGIDDAIQAAKTEAINSAKGYTDEKSGTLDTNLGNLSTSLTDKIDAAKSDLESKINVAKSDAIAAAKSETESQVATAKAELINNIATAKGEAIAAAAQDTENKVSSAKSELNNNITNAIATANGYTDSKVDGFKEVTEKTLDTVNKTIETLQKGLDDLKSYAEADHRDFEGRIRDIEGYVNSLKTDLIPNIQTKLDNYSERISRIEGALENLIDFGVGTI